MSDVHRKGLHPSSVNSDDAFGWYKVERLNLLAGTQPKIDRPKSVRQNIMENFPVGIHVPGYCRRAAENEEEEDDLRKRH